MSERIQHNVTVDAIVTRPAWIGGANPSHIQVLLIQRGKEPFKGHWALPGGFVDRNENPVNAVVRELQEETGYRGAPDECELVGVFGEPGRDPRGHVITIAYRVFLDPSQIQEAPRAGDDAARAAWWPLNALPPMAFDHFRILQKAHPREHVAVAATRADALQ